MEEKSQSKCEEFMFSRAAVTIISDLIFIFWKCGIAEKVSGVQSEVFRSILSDQQ